MDAKQRPGFQITEIAEASKK